MAETCAALLKKRGDEAAIDRGALAYGEAKAEYDAIISCLIVALAQKAAPASLPDIEARLRRGFTKWRSAGVCRRACRRTRARKG